jgi:EmrB/QacA subfamily drug resistance transporter
MNATAASPGAAAPAAGRDPALIKLAVILLIGGIAALLDTTIVNVGVHAIGSGLHAPVSSVQWVLTGYLLSFGMVVPLSGWALRRFGGRLTWMFALALFLLGSVACGLAWNIGSLVAFRVVQGIGGGLLVPIMMTLLVRAAGGRSLGKLMSMISLPVVVVPILGPVLGGVIINWLSWRWLFYVNVPIVVTGLALAWRGLPRDEKPVPTAAPAPRLDVLGLALVSPGLAAVLYGLAQVGAQGRLGTPQVIVPLVAGVVAVALFVVRTLRLDPAGPVEPVIDLRLFRVRSFSGSSALLFVYGLSLFGAMLLLPLYYQQVRGTSVLAAGLLLAPQGVGSLLPRVFAGRLTDKIGPRPVVLAGTALAALGTLPFALAGTHTSEVLLSLALVVRGAGLGAATIAVMAGAYEGLRREDIPHASSATRILQQVGGAFGASVLAVILERSAAHAAAGPAGLAGAFDVTFWWCLGFTALAVLPALLLTGRSAAAPAATPAAPVPAGPAR